ncbi:glycosyltransferase family 39 protein [Xenophilus aerolatus]
MRPRVVACLLAMALLWTLSSSMLFPSPPWDNVEELFWARSLELGYYKHPPLPSWIMGVLVRIAGPQPWLTYAAGILCGTAALAIVWMWARELAGPRRAVLALLLGTLVTYHVQRAVVFNHNTVQLWSIAGYWWMLWRVLARPDARWRDWAALGAFAGLALLTKYSAVVQLAVGLAFIAWEGRWREARVRRGMAVAAAVALLLFAPHLAWVVGHSGGSAAYAMASVHPHAHGTHDQIALLKMVRLQFVRLAPMLAVLAWAWWARPRARSSPVDAPESGTDFDRRFLSWAAFGPLVAVVFVAAVLQVRIVPAWLTTFFLSLPLWAVLCWPGLEAERWPPRRWPVLLGVVVAAHVLAAIGQGLFDGAAGRRFGHAARTNLPADDIAAAVQTVWAERTGGQPLRLLVGDTWFAGAVALKAGPQVDLLVDGEARDSPWLAPGALARDGGMVLILDTPGFESQGSKLPGLLASAQCSGRLQLPWAGGGAPTQVDLRWGIVLPAGVAAPACVR